MWAKTSFRIAFALTVGATLLIPFLLIGNPGLWSPLLWLWLVVPIFCAALPFRFPRRTDLAALLLLAYIFFPYSFSVGIFYIPAFVVMLLTCAFRSPVAGVIR